jgi:hypothetical protein
VTAPRHLAALVLSAVVVALAAACGGDNGNSSGGGDGETDDAWAAVLSAHGLSGEEREVEISGSLEGSELVLTIEVDDDAPGEVQFVDGLYGAEAYALVDGAWTRVDTADARPLSAPVLAPGESAEVRLPVEEADSYRVLVPVGDAAAWADIG